MNRTLFDIGADFAALDQLCEAVEDGAVTPDEMNAALAQWFDELKSEEAAKLERWVHYVRQLEMESAAAKAEAEQFAKKAKARESRVAWLKGRMKEYLEFTRRERVLTSSNRVISVQKNGGKQAMTLAEGVAIPDELTVVKREPDRDAIRAKLEAGEVLDFARLEPRGTSLRIK